LPGPRLEGLARRLTAIVAEWYEDARLSEPQVQEYAIGKANAALLVIEKFRDLFPLTRDRYASRGGTNVAGMSGAQGRRIIQRHFPEARSIGTEAGRTSRGTLPSAERLAERLNAVEGIHHLTPEERGALADKMQAWIVEAVIKPYQQRLKLEPDLDPRLTSVTNVAAILDAARARNQTGAVAQHLVGAKLALRFQDQAIWNYSYSTADLQLNRPGDFKLGDTVFHVTVTPSQQLFQKCASNLQQHFRVVVLVPADRVAAGVQLAELAGIAARVSVSAIETFVGTNVEEIAEFDQGRIAADLRRLLEKYNERVVAVEPDRSLLIEIPRNLGAS